MFKLENLSVIKQRYDYSDDNQRCALQAVYETDIEDHEADLSFLIETVEKQQQEIERLQQSEKDLFEISQRLRQENNQFTKRLNKPTEEEMFDSMS